MDSQDVFSYITSEENAYQTRGVPVVDGYEWSMYKHVIRTTLYKNSLYETPAGELDADGEEEDRPFKNIILPIAKLAYRSEGFDVKDIELYIDKHDEYYKSFLARKFHYTWAIENKMDSCIDEATTVNFDFGGVLMKNEFKKRPVVVPFQQLAFCDQTDIMAGPICEKHSFSPDQLMEMAGRWDTQKIKDLIDMSRSEKVNSQSSNQKGSTPGKYIEVYELHGVLPAHWLNKDEDGEDQEYDAENKEYIRQVQIVAYYRDESKNAKGICLYKGRERKNIYKFQGRGGEAERIHGRALNRGGIEELFEPQVWVNYSTIQLKRMLDVASLVIFQTFDKSFANKNNIANASQGDIFNPAEGKPVTQIPVSVVNETAFNNSISQWETLAKTIGSASDASLSIPPPSGTPFALQQLNTQNGLAEHQYQQGIMAGFFGEVYRDWVLDSVVKDMLKGHEWMAELTLDEMNEVVDNIVANSFNLKLKEKMIISGKVMTPEEIDAYKTIAKTEFMKSNKKFISIAENELKNLPADIRINIAGKQANLAQMTDKLSNIFRQVIANPDVLRMPPMAKLFNEIIESSGFSPMDFSGLTALAPASTGSRPVTEPDPAAKELQTA